MTRFTIRDLFWLVLVVALCSGWWIEHRKPTQQVQVGRYPLGLGANGERLLVDSATGEIWISMEPTGNWWRLAPPPK
jgi:hypothetical protein